MTTRLRPAFGWLGSGFLLAALLLSPPCVQAKRLALLAGISDYQAAEIRDLAGPLNDLESMRRFLVEEWQTNDEDILVLGDKKATKQGILSAIDTLAGKAAQGDQVLIFLTGHGTSRYDRQNDLPIAHGSGAFIPWDGVVKGTREAIADRLLIGNRDLRPHLDPLDRVGAETLVVIDACYSGNMVRSLNAASRAFPTRQQNLVITDAEDTALGGAVGQNTRPPAPPYPYKNITYLSAASDDETAADIPHNLLSRMPTKDGKPHGAFTDALLRILSGELPADADRDGQLSLTELQLATTQFIERRGLSQTPQVLPSAGEDPQGLRSRSLFPAKSAPMAATGGQPPPLRVALGPQTGELEGLVRKEPGMALVFDGQGDIRIEGDGNGWQLLSGPGDAIGRLAAGDQGQAMRRLRLMRWIEGLRWRQLHHNPLGLQLNVEPGDRGGNFRFGEFLTLRLAAKSPVWLVLLDVDSEGNIVPLYPARQGEMKPFPAGDGLYVPHPEPSKSICAREPEGTDFVLALAFAERPPQLESLLGQPQLRDDHPALASWREQVERGDAGTAAAVAQIRVIRGEGQCPR